MVSEIGIDIYTPICIKWITNKNLLYKKINKIKFKKKKKLEKPLGVGLRQGQGLGQVGPRLITDRGSPGGRGFRPRNPAGLLGPEWVGETLNVFPSDLLVPRMSLPVPANPCSMGGPLECGKPSPPPTAPQRLWSCSASTFPPPTSLPRSQDLLGWRGPWRAEV